RDAGAGHHDPNATSRLIPERRNFVTVLRPNFQYMRFFLPEPDQYRTIQRAFALSLFPGILSGFARLFELSFEEMEKRYRANGDNISMLPVFVWKSSIFDDT
ncbi:hypothetical protein E4U38_005785, partial [Claviceps purpurea]